MNFQDLSDLGGKLNIAGLLVSFASWFAASGFGAVLGAVFVVAGFGITWYYKHKEYKMKLAEHEKLMGTLGLDK